VRRILALKVRFGMIPLYEPHVIRGDALRGATSPLAEADLPRTA
jgi:hypothetical protein